MSKVCIDAGHFGYYNRSPGVPAYYESQQMWFLSQYQAAALKKRGIQVVMTRTNVNKDLALVTRGRMAEGCDLFLSNHSNAVGGRMDETVDYPVAYVMRENARTDIDERSEEIGLQLAKVVEDVMGTSQKARTATRAISTDRDKNGLKDDEYYGVLQGAKEVGVPGVILEHSFHTNTKATNWLLESANLKKLAEAEADCIAKWLKTQQPKDELAEAVDKLHEAGIINSPDYWKKGKGYSDENTVALIKKVAGLCK